jgi:hypothetical protein
MRNPGDMEKGKYIRKLVSIIIHTLCRLDDDADE